MTDWIPAFLAQSGYWGVALLMFMETVFPPLPSEVIMPLAGVHAAQRDLALGPVVAAGVAGAMAGNLFWFWLAYYLGLDRFERFLVRYGRLFTLDEREIARGRALFERFGGGIVGVGRVVPTVRSLISIPAGLVRMRLRTFLFYSTLGTFAWTMGLTLAGYFLGTRFGAIDQVLGPLSTAVIAVLFGIYLYRLVMWKRWSRPGGTD
jgi:membrane protein DedA with SNARE-associated domain